MGIHAKDRKVTNHRVQTFSDAVRDGYVPLGSYVSPTRIAKNVSQMEGFASFQGPDGKAYSVPVRTQNTYDWAQIHEEN
jgi:hypothetical protein